MSRSSTRSRGSRPLIACSRSRNREATVGERLSRFARRARVRLPPGAGALRSRLYAAKSVREERTAEDGSIELTVELPDIEILALARTAGVQILEAPPADTPCTPGDAYLESRTA